MDLTNIYYTLRNKTYLRFSGLEFLFWATFGAYYPFLVVYLDGKGLRNSTIGAILCVNSIVVVLAQPFWGAASDWLHSVKKVFILCLSFAAVLILSLPLSQTVLLTGAILAAATFFESPLAPLLDSWVVREIKDKPEISYGTIRLWGSMSFTVVVLICGMLIDLYGIQVIFIVFGVLAVLTILLCSRIKTNNSVMLSSIRNVKIGKLVKNYYYITFLIFALTLFIPHKSAYFFLPNLISQVGGNKVHLGIAVAVMALSEVPVLFSSKYLIDRFKPVQLILMSTVFFTLRQFLLSVAVLPVHVILIQCFQGLSYSLFLVGSVYYIDSLTPQELKSTAQTVGTAIFFGMSGIVGSYGGGWIIDRLGLVALYHIGIIISIGVSLLFLISLKVGKLVTAVDTD